MKQFCISSMNSPHDPPSPYLGLLCPPGSPVCLQRSQAPSFGAGEPREGHGQKGQLLGLSWAAWLWLGHPVLQMQSLRSRLDVLHWNLHFRRIPSAFCMPPSCQILCQVIGPRLQFPLFSALHAGPCVVPLTRSGDLDTKTEMGRIAQIQSAEVEAPAQ